MGLGANVDEEATYPRTFTDGQGNQLNGEYNYVLHFNKDQLPPVEAFWSVTPKNHKSNWLQAPKDGFNLDFNLLLRMYQPSAKILNGTYEVPGVKRVRSAATSEIKPLLVGSTFGNVPGSSSISHSTLD
jgi:hypothetical protein